MTLPEKLKQTRRAAGMTQKQVAAMAGISSHGYLLIEHGKRDVTVGVLERIAGAMGTTASRLLAKKKAGG